MKIKKMLVVVSVLLLMPFTASAEDCSAGDSSTNCNLGNAGTYIRGRVNQGAESILQGTNPSGRVREVKKTIEDCINCGINAITNGFDSSNKSVH